MCNTAARRGERRFGCFSAVDLKGCGTLTAPSTSATAPRISVRFALRDATASAHQRLDRGFAALNLCRLADYRLFLEANAAALLPLEMLAESCGAAALLPDWPERKRSAAIASDIAAAGGQVQDVPVASITLEPAALCGLLYVLEGSRLGARVLLEQVSKGDAGVRNATAFLRHGLAERYWQGFVPLLERVVRTPALLREAIDATQFTFAHYEKAQQVVFGMKATG